MQANLQQARQKNHGICIISLPLTEPYKSASWRRVILRADD